MGNAPKGRPILEGVRKSDKGKRLSIEKIGQRQVGSSPKLSEILYVQKTCLAMTYLLPPIMLQLYKIYNEYCF